MKIKLYKSENFYNLGFSQLVLNKKNEIYLEFHFPKIINLGIISNFVTQIFFKMGEVFQKM